MAKKKSCPLCGTKGILPEMTSKGLKELNLDGIIMFKKEHAFKMLDMNLEEVKKELQWLISINKV